VSPRSPAESDISDSSDLSDLEDEDFALLVAEFLKAKGIVAYEQVRITSHTANEEGLDEYDAEDREWEIDKKEEEKAQAGR